MSAPAEPPQSLTAPHKLKYTYKRSTGPVLGRFFTALRERRILGVRRPDGSVLCPPKEYDPDTGAALSETVEVGPGGVVTSWAWVARPRAKQPLPHPFAYALIQLDGAATPLLHAVDAGSESAMRTGLRVRPRWAEERQGHILDIACFEPGEATKAEAKAGGGDAEAPAEEPVTLVRTPVELDYLYSAGQAATRFLRGIAEGKLLGQRCPVDGKVYVPSRGACPSHGVPTEGELVELADRGTVVSFSIVRIPSENLSVQPPFATASILLDGADTTFSHVLSEVPLEEVRMGMRVQAVWLPRAEWTTSLRNIQYFEPSGEPDAAYESYREHL